MDPLVSSQTNREGSSSSPSSELICDGDLRLGSIVGAAGGSRTAHLRDSPLKISPSSRRMALTCIKVSVCLVVLGCLVHVVYPFGLTPRGSSQNPSPVSLRYSSGNGQDGSSKKSNVEDPKISVYLRDFAGKVIKEFIPQNGNSVELPEFKIGDHIWEGKSIVLECVSSSFPVLWEYSGVGNPKVRVSTYRKSPDYANTNSYTFGATVTISETNYQQTGEFTCKGAKENSLSSSKVYLFVPGKKLFVAKGEINDTVVVKVKDDEGPWVTLPCVVSNQEATAKLFLHTKGGSFKHLELNPSSLTFDSRYGFRLKWKDNPAVENPWGYYICQGELVKRSGDVGKVKYEKLFVKLEEFNGIEGNGKIPESNLKFSFNEESHTLECCAVKASNRLDSVTSPPKLYFHTCISISDCLMTVSSMDPAACVDGKCPDDHSIVPVSDGCTGYEFSGVSEGGILDCVNGDDSSSRERLQFSYDTVTGLVTNFEPDMVRTEQVLYVGREDVSPKDKKEGSQEAIYFCNPSSFLFSDGLRWAVERRDAQGRLEFPEDGFPQRPSIKVDEKIVGRVHCFAPVWDSKTEWRNASIAVPIPT